MARLIDKLLNRVYEGISKLKKYLKFNNYKIRYEGTIQIDNSFNFGKYFNLNISDKNCLLTIKKNVRMRNYCSILLSEGSQLTISEGVFINNYCSINCLGEITIGADTLLGEGIRIYDHNHKYKDKDILIQYQGYSIGKVIIGKNCWIGSNTIILNNVEIGDNVIIGANNLIYKSIPANQIIKANQTFSQISITGE